MDNARGNRVYLVLEAANGQNSELDPFTISETFSKVTDGTEVVKVTRDGGYSIQTSESQATKLLRIKKLKDDTRVKVVKHPRKNQCRCVIKHAALANVTDDRLTKELGPQGVIKVTGIGGSKMVKLITLKASQPPPSIKVGPIRVRTGKYYPLVKFCKNCRRIGHITDSCQLPKRCYNCSGRHVALPCHNPAFCGNCGGGHKPGEKTCPTMTQEREIIKISIDKAISGSRARKAFKRLDRHYLPLPEEEGGGYFEEDEETNGTQELPPPSPTPPASNPRSPDRQTARSLSPTTESPVGIPKTSGVLESTRRASITPDPEAFIDLSEEPDTTDVEMTTTPTNGTLATKKKARKTKSTTKAGPATKARKAGTATTKAVKRSNSME